MATSFNGRVLEVGDKCLYIAGDRQCYYEYRYIHSIDPVKTHSEPTKTMFKEVVMKDSRGRTVYDDNGRCMWEQVEVNCNPHVLHHTSKLFFLEPGVITGERIPSDKELRDAKRNRK